ncbi:hypothetical protein ABW20_dc0105366 [Dactylellina cionopaga]|nr:hypothetical protein ABW20_dc0105366 [Dactylellina cionopaga]
MATIIPPFTLQSATEKLKAAQNLWNTQSPTSISKAYTPDSIWRNRGHFIRGQKEIEEFLQHKWEKEINYQLRKELFAFENRRIGEGEPNGERWEGRIAVQFWYEYQDKEDGMKWKRCYGLEDWTYDEKDGGKMRKRQMSASDIILGKNGDGIAIPEEGIEGRWFVDDVGVDSFELEEKHY